VKIIRFPDELFFRYLNYDVISDGDEGAGGVNKTTRRVLGPVPWLEGNGIEKLTNWVLWEIKYFYSL
jgi:hypothetical protein